MVKHKVCDKVLVEGHGTGRNLGAKAMKKPTVHFKGNGESGNIFFIMARVSEVIPDPIEFNELWREVKRGTYTDALAAIREKVNLIDDDGVY